MTAIEPMVPLPDESSLPATSMPAFPRARTNAPMPLVRVNLLPDEVVAARRGHRTRRRVLIALAALVVALVAVSFFVRGGIGAAKGDLGVAESVNGRLTAQQGKYADAVTLQNDVQAALERLGTLAKNDVGWAAVTKTILSAAPAGVAVIGIVGASNSGTAGSVGGAPGGTGTTAAAGSTAAVGTLVITGNAVDPAAVASYLDALSASKYLANVVATGVTVVETGGYSFGINADLTAAGVTNRYAPAGGH